MVLGHPHEAPEFGFGQHGARRIVGRADQDGLGAGRDGREDSLVIRQVEPVGGLGPQGAKRYARHHREGVVVGVEGLEAEHFVAWFRHDLQREKNGFAASDGHHEIAFVEFNARRAIIAGKRQTIGGLALGAAVGDDAAVVGVKGLQKRPRRGDIRLADVQRMDMDPPCHRGIREGASAMGVGKRFARADTRIVRLGSMVLISLGQPTALRTSDAHDGHYAGGSEASEALIIIGLRAEVPSLKS